MRIKGNPFAGEQRGWCEDCQRSYPKSQMAAITNANLCSICFEFAFFEEVCLEGEDDHPITDPCAGEIKQRLDGKC